jgi:Fur family ferric uptake transcriptional regulator
MNSRRNTIQRTVILEELRRSGRHLAASELYGIVQQRVPNISLGTIYRNLDLLHREGLISRLETAGCVTRFDGDLNTHYHLRCRRCGRIDDVSDPVTIRVEGRITSATGWGIVGPQIEFSGSCPDCRAGGSPSRREQISFKSNIT